MVLTKEQQNFVDVLRSGEYKQCKNALTNFSEENKNTKYCCLGVACKLDGKSQEFIFNHRIGIESVVPEYLKYVAYELVALNDEGKSFAEIADIYEFYVQTGMWANKL